MPTKTRNPGANRRTNRASDDALRAFEDLRALRRFYRSDAALCRALGWKAATVNAWLNLRVARPRVGHRDEVRRLLALVRKAEEWVAEPELAGDWTLEAQPILAGSSPSGMLRVLGNEGLAIVLRDFARFAPRTRVGEPDLPTVEVLRAALRETLGEDTHVLLDRAGNAPKGEADLSDLD